MRAVGLLGLALASAAAHAHGAASETATSLGDAAIVIAIVIAGAGFAIGSHRLAVRRGSRLSAAAHDGLLFAGGLAVLAATLLGPLDAWSERSFAIHMIQHELLMLAAAPLLVLGRPLAHWAWALPRSARGSWYAWIRRSPLRHAWRALTGVAGACAVQTAALWAWHLPAWFKSALEHPGLHILQHATFLAAALCFWWSVLRPSAVRQQASRGIATLFLTTLTTGALGALLTFGSSAWYALPDRLPPFGLTPLEDQQLGGLIMWIPGGTVYVVIALALVARALRTYRVSIQRASTTS